MKTLIGHYCSRCRSVILERHRKLPPFCPQCRDVGNYEIEASTVSIIKLDKEDFPKKPKDIPGQTYMFPQPAPAEAEDAGGLF